MKRLKLLFVMAVVCFCVLSACDTQKNENPDERIISVSPNAPSSVPSATPTMTPTPTPTVSPTSTPTPTPSPTPTPTPVPVIEDLMEETSEPGMFTLPTLDLEGQYLQVYFLNNKLIYFFNESGISNPRILSYDISTGDTVQKEIDYIDPDDYRFHVIKNQYIMLTDRDRKFFCLDDELNEITAFDNPLKSEYPIFVANSEYSKFYYIKGNTLYSYDSVAKETTRLLKDTKLVDANMIKVSEDGKYLFFSIFSKKFRKYVVAYYDFDKAELISDQDNEYVYEYHVSDDGKKILAVDENMNYVEVLNYDNRIFCIEDLIKKEAPEEEGLDPEEVTTVKADNETPGAKNTGEVKPKKYRIDFANDHDRIIDQIDWQRGYFFTVEYYTSQETVTIEIISYDINTGERHSNFILPVDTSESLVHGFSLDTEDGYLIISGTSFRKTFCYAWDYSADTYEDTGERFERLNVIPDYLDQKRKELEDKYHVYIYLGSEIFSTETDYTLSCSQSPSRMYETLCTIDEVFALYPENMLEQIKYGEIKTLGIYLCKGFTKKAEYGIDTAVALAGSDRYERFLAIDVSYWGDLRRNIIHELSHWIDYRINQYGNKTGEFDFEEEWSKLNPDNYYYMNDYNKTSSFGKYTFSVAKEDAYFIDDYSLTKATEDRARLFEYLMRYDDIYDNKYLSSEHIRAKLHMYFDYIRKSYDTTDWPDETIWEHRLNMLDKLYSGDTEITYESIYPEMFDDEPDYSLEGKDYCYLNGYFLNFSDSHG